MTVLVTGASGFIGRHVVSELLRNSMRVRVVCRQIDQRTMPFENVDVRYLSGPGTAPIDWIEAVAGCSEVIHLAALAHTFPHHNGFSKLTLRVANVEFARACAEAAVRSGVKRFVFMSSIGVHGGRSDLEPIHEGTVLKPHTEYARSKAEAEKNLADLVYKSDTGLTIVRAPSVYGPGAPGNFGALMRAIELGLPLPLKSVTRNRRSFVAIDNLVDLILRCLMHPAAANQTLLVSDGEDLSTAEFIRRLGVFTTRPARLLPFPVGWMAFWARLLGKGDIFQSLCGSLQVDISKTRALLGWNPIVTVDEGLRRAVERNL
jgi:nucleoside-diphosphate-sugar epimerase